MQVPVRNKRGQAFSVDSLVLTFAFLAGLVLSAPPLSAASNSFVFARTDYLLKSYLAGLDSVAVADVDGQNGPDIVVLSYTGGGSTGALNILLNNGNGTFATPRTFDACLGAKSIVVGQFNPSTDSLLDVAMICGGTTLIGRMLGNGLGDFASAQTVDLGYLAAGAGGTGHPLISIIEMLRLGSMNGPTFVYGGYMAGTGMTLCFIGTLQVESDLDGAGGIAPVCNVSTDVNGGITDWGPISTDLALGEQRTFPGDDMVRDEAFGFNYITGGLAVTAYTPQFLDKWADGERPFGDPQTGTAVAVADVDNDGKQDVLLGRDLLIADYVPSYPISDNPDHSFASITNLYDMILADFNGDGKVDVAALGEDDFDDEGVTLAVHAGKGDGSFRPFKRFVTRGSVSINYIQVMAVGDFDRDGLADLVTVGEYDKYASVLLNRSPLFVDGFEAGN